MTRVLPAMNQFSRAAFAFLQMCPNAQAQMDYTLERACGLKVLSDKTCPQLARRQAEDPNGDRHCC